jgi:hypothetical protein
LERTGYEIEWNEEHARQSGARLSTSGQPTGDCPA